MTANGIAQSPSSGNVLPKVFTKNGEVFANSKDVAEFFQKEHKNVLRDIRNLISDLPAHEALRIFEPFKSNDLTGETTSHYVMRRDGFTLLGMGFTGRVVVKWKLLYIAAFNAMEAQLRAQTQVPDLSDPKQLLKLLGDYAAKAVELESKVDELMPSVHALDRIATADGSMCVTDAAKTLQVQPKSLFKYLRTNGWVYKRPGTNEDVGYQSKLQADLLEHKIHTVFKEDGSPLVVTQVRVTPKGLARLAKDLAN